MLPAGFEPAIFGVKFRCPRPLDEGSKVERAEGIEPSSSTWKDVALPLSYARERICMKFICRKCGVGDTAKMCAECREKLSNWRSAEIAPPMPEGTNGLAVRAGHSTD